MVYKQVKIGSNGGSQMVYGGLTWLSIDYQLKLWDMIVGLTWIWANYNDLTATSLEIIVNKGNHPQMALIQVSEIL